MASALQARPSMGNPVPNPPAQHSNINFRHPGYKDGYNQLLMLPALDNGGIHYETARITCAILANNRWDGWFTEKQGGDRVGAPDDGILRKQNYYFRISNDENERYPIVPNFTHWRFPHGKLPDLWRCFRIPYEPEDRPLPRQSSTIQALFSRDISCRVTKYVEGTECAHLVPKSNFIWFEQNNMASYGQPSRADANFIDDARNAILLRSDVHKFFDDKRLAFILKPSATSPPTSALVVHVFIPGSTAELIGLYHNLSLQQLTGISIEYLFARFAWTIFDFLKPFLQQGQKRWVCLYNAEASETYVREAAGAETRQFTLRSKSRSASPRKRKLPVVDDDSGDMEELDYERAEEKPRGRRRKRSFSPESSIAPSSSFSSPPPLASSGFTDSLEADSDTDLSFSEVPLKKQKTSKLPLGPASLKI